MINSKYIIYNKKVMYKLMYFKFLFISWCHELF